MPGTPGHRHSPAPGQDDQIATVTSAVSPPSRDLSVGPRTVLTGTAPWRQQDSTSQAARDEGVHVVATRPEVGHIYMIPNFALATRKEAHGRDTRRPHGVYASSPDGMVSLVGRSSNLPDMNPRKDLYSAKVPPMLTKDGFFSMRWLKPSTAHDLADERKAGYLGPLPETQHPGFCVWVDAQ